MHDHEESFDEAAGEPEEEPVGGRTSRLERRLGALQSRQRQPEPISALSLLNTEEIWQALTLIERAGVTPSGEVRNPQAFQEAAPEELAALEHWRELCGEPLDHLELAEELLDRVGEYRGWRSPRALEVALLLKRLELPNESPWYVGKQAEAVVALYAEMDEHGAARGGTPLHSHVRASVRRLERLKEIDRDAPESHESAAGAELPIQVPEASRKPQQKIHQAEEKSDTRGPQDGTERSSGATEEDEPTDHRGRFRRFFGSLARFTSR